MQGPESIAGSQPDDAGPSRRSFYLPPPSCQTKTGRSLALRACGSRRWRSGLVRFSPLRFHRRGGRGLLLQGLERLDVLGGLVGLALVAVIADQQLVCRLVPRVFLQGP